MLRVQGDLRGERRKNINMVLVGDDQCSIENCDGMGFACRNFRKKCKWLTKWSERSIIRMWCWYGGVYEIILVDMGCSRTNSYGARVSISMCLDYIKELSIMKVGSSYMGYGLIGQGYVYSVIKYEFLVRLYMDLFLIQLKQCNRDGLDEERQKIDRRRCVYIMIGMYRGVYTCMAMEDWVELALSNLI
jgi:hypothetical protein